jgi:hypothetical protein
MKWDDDLLLERIHDPRRGQLQLAMYALHLTNGNSIHCRELKATTIKTYIQGVASFLALFTGLDYRKDNPTDKGMGHILKPVYDDLDKYDAMPERREPYSPAMQIEARVQRDLASITNPNGLIPSLADGFECGLATGFRLSEWAQPAAHWNWRTPNLQLLRNGSQTRAIVPNDLEAITYSGRHLVGLQILRVPVTDIVKVFITYRFQKNGDNGERKAHQRNPLPGGHCCVSALYRQLQRFSDLSTLQPLTSSTPLLRFTVSLLISLRS